MKVWLVSGEGENGSSLVISARTTKGLKRMLTKEMCGGDRWARLDVSLDGSDEMRQRNWSPDQVQRAHEKEGK